MWFTMGKYPMPLHYWKMIVPGDQKGRVANEPSLSSNHSTGGRVVPTGTPMLKSERADTV
ncbi:hypothetical protein A2U01_0025805 [Trifolium medium]|uniref:Uncharacterized protein n=1 Tax=Trifolium medium TaxID=97028 RepID=A0A392NY98_9FABA|nr:hypothetical protein [Trifolium medium]